MKEIGTEDTRVGTACTFTGRGAWPVSVRRRRALLVAALAAIGVLGVGAGYFMGRLPGPALPPGPGEVVSVPVVPADPQWSLPSLPPVSPPARAGQSVTGNAPPNRPTGTRHDSASRNRPTPGAAQPGGAASASRGPRGAAEAAPARSRFHVQAGSFADRESAVSLMMRLRGRGYAARLIDGALYRVWVGGYVDRPTAERLASTLRADGFDSTLLPR